MNQIFSELPQTLGVYTLMRLIEERQNTALYEARQTHVDRTVVLEVLQPGVSHAEEVAFLAQARHRVTTSNIPHVADVFESLRAEGIWFLTQEMPQGKSLAELAEADEPLCVLHICGIIVAAAEMYSAYNAAGLSALPLAPTSIYVESSGEVHFLSPLVEGGLHTPASQMQALAAALWAVCPQEKAAGLGRTMTLLQWLGEGVDGAFLEWGDILQTARTIIHQLADTTLADADKPALLRLQKRLCANAHVQAARQFLSRWGSYAGTLAAIIILLSSAGSFFGMGSPRIIPAGNASSILCQQGGSNESVQRQPVSISQYADFMKKFEEMDDDQREELISSIPGKISILDPDNWDAQCEQENLEAPVTGVTYWQALLYARAAGGQLPTVNQLQTVHAIAPGSAALEWSRDEQESPIPGIYDGPAYLLVDQEGRIQPTNSRDWRGPRCGFRVAFPENND